MTFTDPTLGVILAIIIGTLGAIVYALRILVLLERRIARIDAHIEMVVKKIIREELAIESEEKKLEQRIDELKALAKPARKARKAPAKKAVRKTARKAARKTTRKSSRRR